MSGGKEAFWFVARCRSYPILAPPRECREVRMKIVVYGPEQRVGVLEGERVIDANSAAAKLARESLGEALPAAYAAVMAPANLHDFILAGQRALETTQHALEYLAKQAPDERGIDGEPLVHAASAVKLHAPLASRAVRL